MLLYAHISNGDGVVKNSKKIISIILSLVLVITVFPVSGIIASAETASGTCGENLTWAFNESTGELTISGEGAMTDFVSGKTAGWVEQKYKGKIGKIIINEGVTTIGKNAFATHSKLTSVELPQSLIAINGIAFQGCVSLTEITIPDGVTKIGNAVFMGCEKLRTITIGAGLKSYDNQAFDDLENLSRFIVSPANNKFSSDTYGVLFDKEKTTLHICPTQINIESYTIPDSVTSIKDYAFKNCKKLKNIVFGDGVKTIGQWAFYGCTGLTDITIPVSVTKIDKGAFSGCNNLKNVEFLGTEEDWKRIIIGDTNDALNNATITFGNSVHNCVYDDSGWTIEVYPNCVNDGQESAICTICGEAGYRKINATGIHEYGNWEVSEEATCIRNGEEKRKCNWCSAYESRDTAMTEHQYGKWSVTDEPTCTSVGKESCFCECGKIKTRVLEELGHSFGDWTITKQPTIEEKGTEERKCARCDKTETRDVPKLSKPVDTEKILLGDANDSGDVTAVDARLVLQVVAGLKTTNDINFANADAKTDGIISAIDARIILQMVAGLI